MEDAKSIIDAVERLDEHAVIGGTDLNRELALAVLPNGKTIHDLQPYLDKLRSAPRRISTSAGITSVDSFIDYVDRFKTPDSAIFVSDNPEKPRILGIVDFHGQGPDAAPRFGTHKVAYEFPLSDQLRVWSAISGKALSHDEFATFLQDRGFDIANPPLDWMAVDPATVDLILTLLNIGDDAGDIDDGAAYEAAAEDGDDRYIPRSALYKLRQIRFGSASKLQQMARTVEVAVNAKATEGYNSKTGERTVVFSEEHETRDGHGRKIIVPDAFLIRAPVWEGETPQLIPVRLQYRRTGGSLKWFLTLVEWRRVIRYAVKVEAERIKAATSLPVFYGQP